MGRNFEFAFLGPRNNYFAKVTEVAADGQIGSPKKESFGLPETFCERYPTQLFDIHGHDYLSYIGQWKSKSRYALLPSSVIIEEINELRALLISDNSEGTHKEADIILSLGPTSGSFFANLKRLKRYRWANLPPRLEDEIQNNVSKNGYSKIREIAMNSVGGWIIQYENGRDFHWGGQLPPALLEVLSTRKKSKSAIANVYLNHQNPDEYVLLFQNENAFRNVFEHAYISLHSEFQSQIKSLVEQWAIGMKVKNFDSKWHFISSSSISSKDRNEHNALYYSRRGLFHLSRGNPEIAVEYLGEALALNGSNPEIRDILAMTLIATRQALNGGRPKYTMFRTHSWMLDTFGPRLQELQDRMGSLPTEVNQEWSYEMASGKAGSWLGTRDGVPINHFELQGSDSHWPNHNNGGNTTTVFACELGSN